MAIKGLNYYSSTKIKKPEGFRYMIEEKERLRKLNNIEKNYY